MALATAYDKAMDLHCYLEKGGRNRRLVEAMWKATFVTALREIGFNRKSALIMWYQLSLDDDASDGELTCSQLLRSLDVEVFYCSDRWNVDRLARCNRIWRAFDRLARRESPRC